MADISLDCLRSVRDIGAMLGVLPCAIHYQEDDLIDQTFDTLKDAVFELLENCPHPPNVVSDAGPNRTFMRQVRQLEKDWIGQSEDESAEQLIRMGDVLMDWLTGIVGASPSAWRDKKARTRVTSQKMTGTRPSPSAAFIGGGVPGTMPTGEPTWMPDPYQLDTTRQFIRKYSG